MIIASKIKNWGVIPMKDCNCGYCVGGEPLAKFGFKICGLSVSQLILFKE